MGNVQEQLKEVSKELRDLIGELVQEWVWEERHQAIQGAFSIDKADEIKNKLQGYFSQVWDDKTFKKADIEVKRRAGVFANLKPSQKLFTDSDATDLLAVWWPWGHGATISVRLFLAHSTYYEEKHTFFQKIRSIVFGD